ncbi:hypothetical protein ASAP_3208 [Asaia bogorensis]|uniref:Uncharacterized protein n=1 Tax=Asaia bogorensis TaxID=91915 RepID=A0A060QKC7_9PROT|nr:hypothetical protein ASAP_3208 [Asaia bogorensis]
MVLSAINLQIPHHAQGIPSNGSHGLSSCLVNWPSRAEPSIQSRPLFAQSRIKLSQEDVISAQCQAFPRLQRPGSVCMT